MDKPLEITFRNMDRSESLVEVIEKKCGELERFYPHIIGMHVSVETPQRRHRKGKFYHVTVKVHVPRKWLVASHSPQKDIRHENLVATVNDAFDAMGRQLEDYARRQRGDIKHHEMPMQGRITKIFPDRGYGFIALTDGEEIYFHENSVTHKAFSRLEPGMSVRAVLAEEESEQGAQASTVEVLGGMRLVDEDGLSAGAAP